MADGSIVERGAPRAIYTHPRTLLGARALGPVTALPGTYDGHAVQTALGTHTITAADAAPGACQVLWRPEAVVAVGDGAVSVEIDDVMARGADWGLCSGATPVRRALADGEVGVFGAGLPPPAAGAAPASSWKTTCGCFGLASQVAHARFSSSSARS